MKLRQVLILAGVAFVVFYVVTRPDEAAVGTQAILGWLRDGAEAIILFVQNVTR